MEGDLDRCHSLGGCFCNALFSNVTLSSYCDVAGILTSILAATVLVEITNNHPSKRRLLMWEVV
jgi:hypothetical protein